MAELERRPLFGIGTVSRMTGVKAETLRMWERRYQLGASQKSASGYRLFNQSDVEHLQLVAALVGDGVRIGDIARSERRTLEALLASRDNASKGLLGKKPRILFMGRALCDWLDGHQGLLSGVDAHLLREDPAACDIATCIGESEEFDGVVLQVGGLGSTVVERVTEIARQLGVESVLVMHRFASDRWLQEVARRGYVASPYPPDPEFMAAHLQHVSVMLESFAGTEGIGDLARVKPRLFDPASLSVISKQPNSLNCECQRHIVGLVQALAEFEEYSANCSVDNWQEASVHACIYAYANQSRWLMEKALSALVEAHEVQAKEEGVVGS